MVHFIDRLVDILVAKEIIAEQDRTIYHFGLSQFCIKAANITLSILIGLMLGLCLEMILFLLAYISLRHYAGGYHAKTIIQCELMSFALEIIAVLTIACCPVVWILPVMTVSSIVILCLAPIDNEEKPLDETETIIMRRKVRVILAVHWLIAVIGGFSGYSVLLMTIGVTHTLLAAILLLGYLKNRLHHDKLVGGKP